MQRVAPRRAVISDVALLRRELGEEGGSQQESSSSHAASAVAHFTSLLAILNGAAIPGI